MGMAEEASAMRENDSSVSGNRGLFPIVTIFSLQTRRTRGRDNTLIIRPYVIHSIVLVILIFGSATASSETDQGNYKEVARIRVEPSSTISILQDANAERFDPLASDERMYLPLQVCPTNETGKVSLTKCEKVAVTKPLKVEFLSLTKYEIGRLQRRTLLYLTATDPGITDNLNGVFVFEMNKDKIKSLLPSSTFTMDGQHKFFCLNDSSGSGCVVVVAQSKREGSETHYSPHKYRINVFFMGKDAGNFSLANTYITKKKYESLDDLSDGDSGVIDDEFPQIMSLVEKVKSKKCCRDGAQFPQFPPLQSASRAGSSTKHAN